MTIQYGSHIFLARAGESVPLLSIFNSTDFNAGGDYVGPLVVAGVAVSGRDQTLTPSTAGLEFKGQTGEFTTNCVYHYSIQNDSSADVAFKVHHFFN